MQRLGGPRDDVEGAQAQRGLVRVATASWIRPGVDLLFPRSRLRLDDVPYTAFAAFTYAYRSVVQQTSIGSCAVSDSS